MAVHFAALDDFDHEPLETDSVQRVNVDGGVNVDYQHTQRRDFAMDSVEGKTCAFELASVDSRSLLVAPCRRSRLSSFGN